MAQIVKLPGADGKQIEAYMQDGKYFDAASGRQLESGQFDTNNHANHSWRVSQSGGGGMSLADIQALEASRNAAKQAEADRMLKQGLNPDGSPIRPDYENIRNADGSMKDQYTLKDLGDVTVDPRAMDAIRERGLAKGPSAWAQMALEQQKLEESGALDKARQLGAGLQNQTLSKLAMQGGVSSGARERVSSRSLRDQMLAGQDVFRQGQMARANIGVQDENFKTDALKTTAGLDFQKAGLDTSNRNYRSTLQNQNLSNMLHEIDSKRAFDQNVYGEQMKKWAAEKQSEAMSRASGGGKK